MKTNPTCNDCAAFALLYDTLGECRRRSPTVAGFANVYAGQRACAERVPSLAVTCRHDALDLLGAALDDLGELVDQLDTMTKTDRRLAVTLARETLHEIKRELESHP